MPSRVSRAATRRPVELFDEGAEVGRRHPISGECPECFVGCKMVGGDWAPRISGCRSQARISVSLLPAMR